MMYQILTTKKEIKEALRTPRRGAEVYAIDGAIGKHQIDQVRQKKHGPLMVRRSRDGEWVYPITVYHL